MVRISKVDKLDGIRSWSLEAWDTCPGAHDGALACKGCYARGGNYRFNNVRNVRVHNKQDWQRDDWEADMIGALARDRYFRWFDSGDMYALELAWKIFVVMAMTPWCDHWLPTRMHKFAKFHEVLDAMRQLPNVMVRPSSDAIDGSFDPAVHKSTIVFSDKQLRPGVKLCEAYTHTPPRCNGCRACWEDKSVIAYMAHGRTMKTLDVIPIQSA